MNNNNYYYTLLLLIPHLVKPQCASLSRKQPRVHLGGGGGGDPQNLPTQTPMG